MLWEEPAVDAAAGSAAQWELTTRVENQELKAELVNAYRCLKFSKSLLSRRARERYDRETAPEVRRD